MRLRPDSFDDCMLGVITLWILFMGVYLIGAGWLVYAIIEFLGRH